MPRYTRQ